MTDVFISYSRKDIAFARLLHEALIENGLETWIDWQDIPPSADWLAEVYEAIEAADAFVFVISETSLLSEICGLEIDHANKHNKRLIPIVIKDVEAEKVPKELSVLNWIFFDDAGEKFAEAMEDLVTAIKVDQAWVKGHTRFQNRALDWERKEKDRGLLLRGADLSEAEAWLSGSAGKDPQPTALQTQFILKSREDATRRQRMTLLGVGAALVVAVGLGVLAWTQRNVAVAEGYARATAQVEAEVAQAEAVAEADARATQQTIAEEQRDIAEEQRDLALSRYYAGQAVTQLEENYWELALLLAVEAGNLADTFEAKDALREVLGYSWRTLFLMEGHLDGISSVAWSPDHSMIATAGEGDLTFRVWDGNTGEVIRIFETGSEEVTEVSWSPDGEYLLAQGYRFGFAVYDSKTWDLIFHQEDEGFDVFWPAEADILVAFYYDPGNHKYHVFNATNGKLIRSYPTEKYPISYEVENGLSHDQTKLITWHLADDGSYLGTIFDIRTGELISLLPDVPSPGNVYWSYDGHMIATIGMSEAGFKADIWDTSSGDLINSFNIEGDPAGGSTGAWHPSGDYFMVSQCELYDSFCFDSRVRIWSVATGVEISSYAGNVGSWSPDGSQIFAFRNDHALDKNYIKILSTQSGTGIDQFYSDFQGTGTGTYRTVINWHDDGNLVLTSTKEISQTILWDADTKTAIAKVPFFIADTNFTAEWDQEQNYILVRDVKTISRDPNPNARIISLNPGSELPSPGSYLKGSAGLAWAADGTRYLTSGCEEMSFRGACTKSIIQLWDLDSGELLNTYRGHTGEIVDLDWNTTGDKFLSVSWDKTTRVWDVEKEEELLRLEHPDMYIKEGLWSPDGSRILTYISSSFERDNFAFIWDSETGELLRKLTPQDAMFDVLAEAAWSKDGSQVLTFTCDKSSSFHNCYAQIWDAGSGELVWRGEHPEGQYGGKVSWSPDESMILSGGSSGVLRVWDVSANQEKWSVKAHEGGLLTASWSPDGSWIATGGADQVLRIFNSDTGDEIRTIYGFSDNIRELAWCSDGNTIVTRTDDSIVQLWDMKTGEELTRLDRHSNLLNSEISPDERFILTTSELGTTRIWYIHLNDLMSAACEISPRNMTIEEWEAYFPDNSYQETCSSAD